MKENTASQIAQGVQLLQLNGYDNYTVAELAKVSGVSPITINRNKRFLDIVDTALHLDRGSQW